MLEDLISNRLTVHDKKKNSGKKLPTLFFIKKNTTKLHNLDNWGNEFAIVLSLVNPIL